MKPVHKWLLIAGVAALALLAGIQFGRHMHPTDVTPSTPDVPVASEGKDAVTQLLSTSFTTPDGGSKKLSEWRGKILVINFWATWCPPCREEMPEFSLLQGEYVAKNVQFVGIAIDEAAKVVEYAHKTPTAYPLLVGSTDATAQMASLGNQQQVLPFTVIIGKDGKLQSSHVGQLHRAELEKLLLPLL